MAGPRSKGLALEKPSDWGIGVGWESGLHCGGGLWIRGVVRLLLVPHRSDFVLGRINKHHGNVCHENQG